MRIKIIGVPEEKIIIALNRLLKAFDRLAEIVKDNEDYRVYFAVIIYAREIKVVLKCGNILLENSTSIISDVDYDTKYLILSSFYKLLAKLTNKKLSYGVLTGIRPTKLVHQYKKSYQDREIITLLTDKYLIDINKAKLLLKIVNHQLQVIKDYTSLDKEVSIYINIPFCLSRCRYCSFTSYPSNYQLVSKMDYIRVLALEIKEMAEFLHKNKLKITTVYIGGGTPSALNKEELTFLLDSIENYLIKDKLREYTLECGRPDSLSVEKLKIINDRSITRVSINPQTFNELTLKEMNRNHTIKDIYDIYEKTRKYTSVSVNMDLIIGLPNETITDYMNSLDKTILLEPEAITVHHLAQKRGSELFKETMDDKVDYNKYHTYAYNKLMEYHYLPYYLYRQKNISGNLDNIGYAKRGFESIYNILMIEEHQTIIGLGCASSSKFLDYKLILSPKDLVTYINSYQTYLDKKYQAIADTLMKVEGNR